MNQFLNKQKTNKKPAFWADFSGVSTIVCGSGLSTYFKYSKARNLVKWTDLKTKSPGGKGNCTPGLLVDNPESTLRYPQDKFIVSQKLEYKKKPPHGFNRL